MTHTKSLNKIRIIIYSIYGLVIIMAILVIYLIRSSIEISETINPQLVKTYTTQLDMEKFNKALHEIQLDTAWQ